MVNNEDDIPTGEDDEISAILNESIKSNSKLADISPEDAAWVDSCLLFDPYDTWDAVREALLETLATPIMFTDNEESSSARLNEIAKDSNREADEHFQPEEIAEPALMTEGSNEDEEDNAESLLESQEGIESRDEIFKVWELEGQEHNEENELVKELKKALTETKYSGPSKSPNVDELVAGMGELSIEPPSET